MELQRIDSAQGTLLWQLPAELAQRMLHAPKEDLHIGALAELEQNMQLVMYALVHAAGNRRRGMKVNNALNELMLALDYVPTTNHTLEIPKE